MTIKMIMDLDTGIDDALALAYALSHDDIELLAVTTSFGNVTGPIATRNTLNLLHLFGYDNIPVYEGALAPWDVAEYVTSPHLFHIHGDNGIGNVTLPETTKIKEEQNAVDFIIEAANKYGDELLLYTAGPMTNLADAIKKDKKAIKKIGKIISMAGALTVLGNVSPFAEANIHRDPKAAKYVFDARIPMTFVGLDVTLKTMIKGSDIDSWREVQTQASEAMIEMATYYYTNEYDDAEIGGAMHDPLAVEVAINPAIITDSMKANLTVEVTDVSVGRTIGDIQLLQKAEKVHTICLDVDSKQFTANFINGITKLIKTNA